MKTGFLATLLIFVFAGSMAFAQQPIVQQPTQPLPPTIKEMVLHVLVAGPTDFEYAGWTVKFTDLTADSENDSEEGMRATTWQAVATQGSATRMYLVHEGEGYDEKTAFVGYAVSVKILLPMPPLYPGE